MIIRSQEKHYGRQRESLTYNTEPVVLPQRKAGDADLPTPRNTKPASEARGSTARNLFARGAALPQGGGAALRKQREGWGARAYLSYRSAAQRRRRVLAPQGGTRRLHSSTSTFRSKKKCGSLSLISRGRTRAMPFEFLIFRRSLISHLREQQAAPRLPRAAWS